MKTELIKNRVREKVIKRLDHKLKVLKSQTSDDEIKSIMERCTHPSSLIVLKVEEANDE